MKLAVSKELCKICTVVIIWLVFVMSVTSCGHSSIINNGEGEGDKLSMGPTVSEYFGKTEGMAFLKLEILEIYDDAFKNKIDIAFQADLIMLRCNLIADLHESGMEVNREVIVPVFSQDADVNDCKNWLSAFDVIYVKTPSYANNTYITDDNTEMTLKTNMAPCDMLLYDVLPVINGAVYINMVDEFHEEQRVEYMPYSEISGIDDFCYEGISCEEFEANVRELSKEYDTKELNKENIYEKEECKIYSWFVELHNAFLDIFNNIFCK